MQQEIWETIKDYPDYQISNLGRVKSWKGVTEKILIPWSVGAGYLQVILDSFYKVYVHRLVVEAFIGPIPEGKEVNHLNGIKTDNRLENLEIVTRSENEKHAYKVGLKGGEKHYNTRFTNEDIIDIRELYSDGFTYHEIASSYNVHWSTISQIVRRINWKHI